MSTPATNDKKNVEINIAPKNDFIVSLDIGTTKIVVIAGQKNEFGKLQIISYGKVCSPSGAIIHGLVLNVKETAMSIQRAIEDFKKCNPQIESIGEVYVGIAGEHVKCFQKGDDLTREGNGMETMITEQEVKKLIGQQYKTFVQSTDEILHVYPIHYFVDNHSDIKNPVGMFGHKIGGNFNLISADKSAIQQIKKSIELTGLHMKEIFLQPTSSAKAVMCEDDYDNTVAVLDIGGGTSDLAIFEEGTLKHTSVIGFGGESITKDIKDFFGIPHQKAESLKIHFGSAVIEPNDKQCILIKGYRGLNDKEIARSVLCGIIQARMGEIFDLVNMSLKSIGLDGNQLSGGLILTGGGSQLKNIKQLASYKTGAQVRIGFANEHLAADQDEAFKSPSLSTSIGIMMEGFAHSENVTAYEQNEVHKPDTPTPTPDAEVPTPTPYPNTDPREKRKSAILGSFMKKVEDIFEFKDHKL